MNNRSFAVALVGLWAGSHWPRAIGRRNNTDCWGVTLPRRRPTSIQNLTAAKPVAEQVQTLACDWAKNPTSRPAPSFLGQWHGSLVASASGEHLFRIEASRAVRLIFDGRLLVDVWSRAIPTQADCLPVSLEKGKPHGVIVEHLNINPKPPQEIISDSSGNRPAQPGYPQYGACGGAAT